MRDEFGYGGKNAAEREIAKIRLFNDYLGLPTDLSICNLLYSTPPSETEPEKEPEEKPESKPNPKPEDGETSGAGDVYEAIELINQERVKAGLSELEIDETLMEMAAVRAEELVWGYSQEPQKAHTRPDGSDWSTIFSGSGETGYANENAAAGNSTAEATIDQWMNSSGHKANILSKEIGRIGVGHYKKEGSKYTHYWIMIGAQ